MRQRVSYAATANSNVLRLRQYEIDVDRLRGSVNRKEVDFLQQQPTAWLKGIYHPPNGTLWLREMM